MILLLLCAGLCLRLSNVKAMGKHPRPEKEKSRVLIGSGGYRGVVLLVFVGDFS